MEVSYTKNDLEQLDDRYENCFSLSYETTEKPDFLVEMTNTPYLVIRDILIKKIIR